MKTEANYMQLCLGTVQFGLDYGITGQKKPPQESGTPPLKSAPEGMHCAYVTHIYYSALDPKPHLVSSGDQKYCKGLG